MTVSAAISDTITQIITPEDKEKIAAGNRQLRRLDLLHGLKNVRPQVFQLFNTKAEANQIIFNTKLGSLLRSKVPVSQTDNVSVQNNTTETSAHLLHNKEKS